MDRVLHAGFHKTGSTFLQRQVFPLLPQVQFLGSRVDLAKLTPLSSDKAILFSNEAASGYPYPVAEEFSLDKLASCVELLNINKIIIVQRQFHSWCLSLYFQTLNEGYSWSLEDFLHNNRENLITWREAAALIEEYCNFNNVSFHYESYEDMCTDTDATVERICDFIGTSYVKPKSSRANPSRYGNVTLATYRILNFLCRHKLVFKALKVLRITPRRLIRGGLGSLLDKISNKKLTSEDVMKVIS